LIFNLNYFHRIGVTEKGFATLELNVEMSPGHSSIPPKETAIGVLAKAVSALETNPHPSMFGNGPEMDFFSYISPSVSGALQNKNY
jgi:carboxypeptidase PM20D1